MERERESQRVEEEEVQPFGRPQGFEIRRPWYDKAGFRAEADEDDERNEAPPALLPTAEGKRDKICGHDTTPPPYISSHTLCSFFAVSFSVFISPSQPSVCRTARSLDDVAVHREGPNRCVWRL